MPDLGISPWQKRTLGPLGKTGTDWEDLSGVWEWASAPLGRATSSLAVECEP
jgi:hypothetical protein